MRIVIYYLGHILKFFSVFFILPIICGLWYRENITLFAVAMLLSFLLGAALKNTTLFINLISGEKKNMTLHKAMLLSAISFLVLSIIGSIPFLSHTTVLNAFFEAVSGFTTTGLSIFPTVDILPRSFLLWRAETQWIGGIGIIIIFLKIFTSIKKKDTNDHEESIILKTQSFADENIEIADNKSTKEVVFIYLGYSLIGLILLMMVKTPFFYAVTTTFTAISTGGFYEQNIFNPGVTQLTIISLMMLLGSLSFISHHKLFKGDPKKFFTSLEFKFIIITLIIATALVFPLIKNLKLTLFQIITSLTTTGYTLVDINSLPTAIIAMMICFMIIGGSIGSSAGGIKISRAYIAIKSIWIQLRRMVAPKTAIIPLKIDKKVIQDNNILSILVFIISYMTILLLGIGILIFSGITSPNAIFIASSAIGTVGLSTIKLAGIPVLAKLCLIILMLIGRLEIFPILLLLKPLINRK